MTTIIYTTVNNLIHYECNDVPPSFSQVNQQCIPVFSIYACNMERIMAGLWHPTAEEEQQQSTVALWDREQWKQTPYNSQFPVR